MAMMATGMISTMSWPEVLLTSNRAAPSPATPLCRAPEAVAAAVTVRRTVGVACMAGVESWLPALRVATNCTVRPSPDTNSTNDRYEL